MKKTFILLISLLLISCSRSSEYSSSLLLLEKNLEENPSQALIDFSQLKNRDTFSERDKALYYLICHELSLDRGASISSDTLLGFCMKIFLQNNDQYHYAHSLYYQGVIYEKKEHYHTALNSYLRCYDLSKANHFSFLEGKATSGIGRIYQLQRIYEESVKKHRSSILLLEETKNNRKSLAREYCEIGTSYLFLKKYDSTFKYSYKSLNIASVIKDSFVMDRIYNSLSRAYSEIGDSAKSQEFVKKYFSLNFNAPRKRIDLISLRLRYTNNKSSSIISHEDYVFFIQENTVRNNIENSLSAAKLYERRGLYKNALSKLKEVRILNDSFANLRKGVDIKEAEEIHYKNSLERRNKLLTIYKYCFYSLFFIFLTVISLSLISFWKNKKAKLNYKLEKQKSLSKLHLEVLNNRLSMIRRIIQIYYQYSDTSGFQKKVKSVFDIESFPENIMDDFQDLVNGSYSGVISYLKATFPALSRSDLVFCSLLAAGFTTRELVFLYDYKSEDGVYVRSNRIGKKMLINVSLNLYLLNLIESLKLNQTVYNKKSFRSLVTALLILSIISCCKSSTNTDNKEVTDNRAKVTCVTTDFPVKQVNPDYILTQSLIYERKQDYKSAYESLFKYIDAAEEIRIRNIKQNFQLIESRYNRMDLEKINKSLVVNNYIIVVVFIISLILLFYTSLYLIAKKRNKIIQEINLREKKEELHKRALDYRMKTIRELISLCIENEHSDNFKEKFREYLTNNSLKDSFLSGLEELVNDSYYGIIDYLNKTHTFLKGDDILFCSLILTGFSPQEMSVLYGYKTEKTIYTKCYRLSSKMGIEKSLSTYLNETVLNLKG